MPKYLRGGKYLRRAIKSGTVKMVHANSRKDSMTTQTKANDELLIYICNVL